MTHLTGPRKHKVDALSSRIYAAVLKSGCTISEGVEAMHEAGMALLRDALRPLEPFTCPTCPEVEDITPKRLNKIEAAVRKAMKS